METDEWSRSLRTMGLPADAAVAQIHAAYRKLVRQYHPDVNRTPQAEPCFREIVEAYRTASALARMREAAKCGDVLRAVREDPLIEKIGSARLSFWSRSSHSAEVRASALAALGVRGEVTIGQALAAARQDRDALVRAVARSIALEGSGGRRAERQGSRTLDQALRAMFQLLKGKDRKCQYATAGTDN
jgi:hypothetical protein